MSSFKNSLLFSFLVVTVVFGSSLILDEVLKMYQNNTLKSNPNAVKALVVEANSGNIDAMYLLATAYKNEKLGESDLEKAKQWYKKAADLGDSDAMLMLGWIYYKQASISGYNLRKAKYWFKKAASLGVDEAVEMLSLMES